MDRKTFLLLLFTFFGIGFPKEGKPKKVARVRKRKAPPKPIKISDDGLSAEAREQLWIKEVIYGNDHGECPFADAMMGRNQSRKAIIQISDLS